MSNYSKPICKPHDPCKAQLYKIVQYRYYRFPTKYICTPVEWGTKSEKQVYWEPQKPYPPVKVPCEDLRQKYYKDEKGFYGKEQQSYPAPEFGYEQGSPGFEQDGDAQDYQDGGENGGYGVFDGPAY